MSFRMSEPDHLKCPCQQCGDTIEFPGDGLGQWATCPHCGAETMLFDAATLETPDGSHANDSAASSSKQTLLWIAVAVLALAGTTAWFLFKGRLGAPASSGNEPRSATNLDAAEVAANTLTNGAAFPKAPKSIDDLKVGPIALEKSRGSSLVYAVGVMRNESTHQRFGVNLELELTDARGNKAGTAKDYRAVLEPRQEWRFRALVLDSKAVSAKVAAIREEE
jgi:hypothetical protein